MIIAINTRSYRSILNKLWKFYWRVFWWLFN